MKFNHKRKSLSCYLMGYSLGVKKKIIAPQLVNPIKHFKACRDDIELAYLNYSDIMYDFLLLSESIESRHSELEVFIEPIAPVSVDSEVKESIHTGCLIGGTEHIVLLVCFLFQSLIPFGNQLGVYLVTWIALRLVLHSRVIGLGKHNKRTCACIVVS